MTNASPIRVLLASAEAAPFAKTGGLGDVAGTLPFALKEAGAEASVIMPRYSAIPETLLEDATAVATVQVPMPWGLVPCGIDRVDYKGVAFYFVANDRYFVRDGSIYGHGDDIERFAFFSRSVCEAIALVPELACDVLHCNDWQTALAPIYLREFYNINSKQQVKTVFTVHNALFQGLASEDSLGTILGLASSPIAAGACAMDDGSVNLMRGALAFADYITTVSPTYVEELKTPAFGERLDSAFRRRTGSFSGVLNGIDLDAWNPETDPMLPATYSVDSMEGKAVCKAALQKEMGLAVDETRPLVTMVSRLTDQKGVRMVCDSVARLMERGVQLAILGTGDSWLEYDLAQLASQYPGQMSVALRFDNALSHRMYAAGDLFLMPSLFEPCGLSQMNAMRYGTLPVVRETGGLRDTVIPYNKYTGEGTGFSFANPRADEMADILLNACEVFWTDSASWERLQRQAMTADFSWNRAAADYLAIYKGLL